MEIKRAKDGKFLKGSGGKPKGSFSKKTHAWMQLGDFITESGAQRAVSVMKNADDKEFMTMYTSLLDYFKPKMARTINENINTEVPQYDMKSLSNDELELFEKLLEKVEK